MKLPISWLRDWIELDGTAEAVADALTRRGFYVEGIERLGHAYPGVVVARVLEVQKHPNADKLSLCRVDGGSGEVRVVCGAPNVHAGMIAPLATVGAQLPGGLIIKKSRIRGEESEGMLCSARELELSEDHQGILDLMTYLGGTPAIGAALDSLMPPPDEVLEVEVPFNRPDGLGVLGLAREVKAALGGHWNAAAQARLSHRWQGRSDFDLELEDAEGCPRYIAQAIDGVRIAPSPPWLQRKLEAIGQRPISNVVDLTNLVLFELGQPVHAFDLDRLAGPAIRVRRARAGEKLTTLDGRERALDTEVLVIADRERPIALAGIMGGADSEVREGTTRLLLECAWFEPRRVRRGSRFLGLSTEASKRFERGVDAGVGSVASARFLALLKEVCPDARAGAARERNLADGRRRTLTLRTARYARVVGRTVSAPEAKRLLESLEFTVEPGDPVRVGVPSWRPDVTIEDDLVEEVARAEGYDRIPEAPLETRGVYATRTPAERAVTRAREAMRARGISEAMCTTLVSEKEAVLAARLLGEAEPRPLRLVNAMSTEGEALRPNLLPGLLRACAHNLKQGVPAVRLFEVGSGFRASGGALPEEIPMVAALVCGPRYAHAHDASQQGVDFAEARGMWDAWLGEMRVDSAEWRSYSAPGWKPGASAEVARGTSRIGWAGALSQSLLREWDIEVPSNHDLHVFVALLDPLTPEEPAGKRASMPGRFPSVRRDLAFFVPERVTHRELERTLADAAGEWLSAIEVFDVYSFAIQWQHPERTLNETEIQGMQDRMVAAVVKTCGGRLRER
jgi:phenylalanyl-tRNA synthetase beta chain